MTRATASLVFDLEGAGGLAAAGGGAKAEAGGAAFSPAEDKSRFSFSILLMLSMRCLTRRARSLSFLGASVIASQSFRRWWILWMLSKRPPPKFAIRPLPPPPSPSLSSSNARSLSFLGAAIPACLYWNCL